MALLAKKELHAMGLDELRAKLNELRTELIKEQAQIGVGTTPKSPGRVKEMKKTIAKIIHRMEVQKGK